MRVLRDIQGYIGFSVAGLAVAVTVDTFIVGSLVFLDSNVPSLPTAGATRKKRSRRTSQAL